MSEKKFIMAIDQGTTGTRVILFDRSGDIKASAYHEIKQYYPEPGWVEHDPLEYLDTVRMSCGEIFASGVAKPDDISAIGITNQRETTILWDKATGRPIYNAIVWQCRRTADRCEELKRKGYEELIRTKTGLMIDAYFSGTKIEWIIENVPEAKELIAQDRLLMGTIDSWLIWNFSGRESHVTDYSNASRTLLLNIFNEPDWDPELLEIFGVPRSILPELKPSSGIMATTSRDAFFGAEIPIAGVAGDQHAATFGQCCFEPGMAKNTYGTALALFMNTGPQPVSSKHGLTTNLGWRIDGITEYALEGVIFIGGAAIQWLRDGLGIIKKSSEVDVLAESVSDTGGVYMVPAFTGLCAPYWDQYARGTIVGITRGTGREHISRACLESIAYQTKDVVDAMNKDFGHTAPSLRVDGGSTVSEFLMQFQADILGIPVEKPKVTEMASRGAAYLAGLGVGFWKSKNELQNQWLIDKVFEPLMTADQRESLYAGWQKAVGRSLDWAEKGE